MTNRQKMLNTLRLLYNELKQGRFVGNTVEIRNHLIEFDGSGETMFNLGDGFVSSEKYIKAELDWYKSQNLDVTDIGEKASIWNMVCDENKKINSNYGFLILSSQNGRQYENVLKELKSNPLSRRAVMYYTNPWMHYQGGKDHVCTVYVAYYIRDNALSCTVSMRSNDFRYGLMNDLPWQQNVLYSLHKDLVSSGMDNLEIGSIYWHATSLHLYDRHYNYLRKLFEGESIAT